jgi:hypothetical protein
MNTQVMSSSGSTQNAVLAAPPQPKSPSEAGTLAAIGSIVTEPIRPKPTPSNAVSLNSGRPNAVRSSPSGRWLLVA